MALLSSAIVGGGREVELGGSIASERSLSLSEGMAVWFVKVEEAGRCPLLYGRLGCVEETGWYITLLAEDKVLALTSVAVSRGLRAIRKNSEHICDPVACSFRMLKPENSPELPI